VRYQIVVYSGAAFIPVRGAPGECISATPSNVARTMEVLESLPPPTGRSNHIEGLRTALSFHSDLVVFFTDADDVPRTAMRAQSKQFEKPVTICIAKVGAEKVEAPVELK
jgi:hypothetical protein